MTTTSTRRFVLAVLALAAFLVAPAPSRAQCPLPDNLDGGPCWGPTDARLPDFPPMEQESLEICWRDCNVEARIPCLARWGRLRPAQKAPIPPLCSVFVSRLDLVDPASGAVKWSGPIRCWYSRTWLEADPGGRVYQVWRFLVNGDMLMTAAAGAEPCPVPPCARAFGGRVHFWGHLDVAEVCGPGVRFISWSLNHDCDTFHHAPGFNRSGAFHPERSYTFVGPAAGFVPTPLLPPEGGTTILEDVRPLDLIAKVTSSPPRGDICVFEEPLEVASLEPVREFCPCAGPAGGPPQYVMSNYRLSSLCGTSVLGNPDVFPPAFISKAIGFWTDPFTFPGEEQLRVNLAGTNLSETCRRRDNEFHVFYGVTTIRGWEATQLTQRGPGGPLPPIFVDQGNSMRFPGFTTTMNVKYVTDVILNLNF